MPVLDQNRVALLALHFLPGVGDHLIRQLVSYCGSADKVFNTPKGKLLKIPGIGAVTATAILQGKSFENAEKELRKAEKERVKLLFFTDKEYPSRLKAIHDAPSLLYVKGNVNFEYSKTIAIIGTRRATDYGKRCVEDLTEALVPHQPLIVSGLAYGIDIHAHKTALKHDLANIGVIGSGIDVIYPSAHAETARKMQAHGGLVTEFRFGTKPDAHHFPARNRIVAGLSDAVIIVEAGEGGGALITADIANGYHKDVFAFPGNIGQSFSEGCNNLIKSNKAHLITSVKDLEYIMNWDLLNTKQVAKPLPLSDYEEPERIVLQTLMNHANHTLMIDEISWRTNLPIGKVASILLGLEFKGVIQSLPGKLYKIHKQVI